MNLYEIAKEAALIIDGIPYGGEIDDAVIEKLEALQMTASRKIDFVCSLVANAKSASLACREESRRLAARAVAKEGEVDRLRAMLKRVLDSFGTRKIQTDLFSVWVQKNPPSAELSLPLENLPDELRVVRYEPNKALAIKIWRDSGESPVGFEISQSESVRIK